MVNQKLWLHLHLLLLLLLLLLLELTLLLPMPQLGLVVAARATAVHRMGRSCCRGPSARGAMARMVKIAVPDHRGEAESPPFRGPMGGRKATWTGVMRAWSVAMMIVVLVRSMAMIFPLLRSIPRVPDDI